MKTIVFAFHYIRNKDYINPGIHPLRTDHFEKMINFCKKKGDIVDPVNFFKKKLNPYKLNFLFTFDDGLVDHFNVLPILNKNNIKGIFFLCSSFYQNNEMLTVHKFHHIRSKINEKSFNKQFFEELKNIKFNYKVHIKAASKFYLYDNKRNALMKYLINFVLNKKDTNNVINMFAKKYNIDFNEIVDKLYLSIDQIKKIKSFGNIFGLHGHTHKKLNDFSKINKEEIEINKSFLAEYNLNNEFNCFAYPYGRDIALPKNLLKFSKINNLDYCFSMEKIINNNNYNKENIYRFSPNNYQKIIEDFLKKKNNK